LGRDDHGQAGRHRLQRHDAEILFLREQDRLCAPVQIGELLVIDGTHETDIRLREPAQPPLFDTGPDNPQRPAEAVECADCEVEILVRNKASDH